MKKSDVIHLVATLLVVVGGILGVSYLFSDPKLPQYYLIDPKYWLRMIPAIVGVLLMCVNGSRE